MVSALKQCIDKNIPNSEVIIRPRDKVWMNSKVCSAIQKRNRLLKQFNRLKTSDCWTKYKLQQNHTMLVIREANANYYLKLNRNLSDPLLCKKKWWSTVKSLYSNKIQTSIPSIKENLSIISDAKQKAAILNEYFVSMATVADIERDLPPLHASPSEQTLSSIQTSTKEIKKRS